jgi:hypothetical protein
MDTSLDSSWEIGRRFPDSHSRVSENAKESKVKKTFFRSHRERRK